MVACAGRYLTEEHLLQCSHGKLINYKALLLIFVALKQLNNEPVPGAVCLPGHILQTPELYHMRSVIVSWAVQLGKPQSVSSLSNKSLKENLQSVGEQLVWRARGGQNFWWAVALAREMDWIGQSKGWGCAPHQMLMMLFMTFWLLSLFNKGNRQSLALFQ